jgi:putative molybdopterin biosynthesis protein
MSVRRNVYLDMKTLEEARCLLFESFPLPDILAEEILPVPDAVDRVLAAPVTARISSPSFHVAAMDGIAVKAEITFGVSETKPKVLTVDEDAFYVNTGHVLPENTDAVIMVEVIQELDEDRVKIEAPAFPWQNVRKVGEDIVATELLFPQNHAVTPYCVGALLTGGVYSVAVRKRPKALIIPTGSELVDWRDLGQDTLEPGKVIESNSFVLGKLIESWGGTFVRNKMIRDDADLIRECVEAAIEDDFDFVLVAGGSSAGSEDYSKRVIQDLGTVLVHGVTIMPGKPIIIGEVRRKPVFGIPGYPVSAIIAFEQFVGPMMLKMLGQPERKRDTVAVEPTRKLTSKLGVEEFVRVKLGKVGDRIVATPLPRGAGSITSLTEADGIIRVPNHMEGLNEHAPVQAELLRPVTSLKHTIVVVGSHDNTLDILADQIKADHPDVTLSSSHVGSMGGLMALRKGVCHLAGAHLLDSTDGSYNTSYVKKYLPNIEIKLVTLVLRDQGLIVPRGNPKGIKGIEDLAQGDISIINRQLGSGTRILLDYRLQQLGIENDTIRGYQNEEFTHMAVAVAVLSGAADVGLGIHAAAKALDLDFIPVITEQYDLVIPEIHFQTDLIQILLNTIATHDFKSRVQALGGYHTEKTGEISTPPV